MASMFKGSLQRMLINAFRHGADRATLKKRRSRNVAFLSIYRRTQSRDGDYSPKGLQVPAPGIDW